MSAFELQLTLARRYLLGRRMRAALTTLAVVLAVMLIFGLNGMLPAMMEALQRAFLVSAGQVDLEVRSASGGTFDPRVVKDVAGVAGVQAATPALRRALPLPKDTYGDVAVVTVVGVDPETVQRVHRYRVVQGRFLRPTDVEALVLPVELARQMKVRLNSQVELPSAAGTTRFRILGMIEATVIPGAGEIFMPLTAAQRVLGERGNINGIDALFVTGADRAVIQRTVQRKLGTDYAIGGIESGSTLFASMVIGQFMMNMFGVFALVMGGFIILNTFRTVVSERRHDIGMLRAIGASRRLILGMFLTESLIQGVLGTAAGMVAGWLLATGLIALLNPIYAQYFSSRIGGPVFSASTWTTTIILGLGMTMSAALIPAVSAGRITPLEALRPAPIEAYEKAVGRRAWAGAVVLALAVAGLLSQDLSWAGLSTVLLLIGLTLVTPAFVKPVTDVFGDLIDLAFARVGNLARSSLQRNPGRAAITASAIMVSMATLIAMVGMIVSIFGGFIGYLDKSLGTDLLVLPQSLVLSAGNVGADERLVNEIRRTRGVGDIATLRMASGKLSDGNAIQVIGIDPVEYPKVASFEFSKGGSPSDVKLLANKGTLMVNGITAAQSGIGPGSRLTLETPSGRQMYKVVAVGSDYLNAKISTAYVSQDTLKHDFRSTANLLVLANLAPGYRLAQVRQSLEQLLKRYPQFTLWDSVSFRATQMKTFDQAMAFYYVMIAALALPTLLALLNTLAMSVLARTREIGMLRAVGSTRGQIRRLVLTESLLLAALGTSMGIAAGIWLGYVLFEAMNAIGFVMPYDFPLAGILMAIAVGLVFAVIAALIPARQAARLNIVDALHYE